jgi:glycyl-tRNA synthetase
MADNNNRKNYKGSSGLFDLGPLGSLIQNNLVDEWKKHFVIFDKMHQVDCSILTPEPVLRASGHLAKFSDIMVKDSKTHESFRVDHLIKAFIEKILKTAKPSSLNELNSLLKRIENSEITKMSEIDAIISQYSIKSPATGNSLTNAAPFNLMFQTQLGANDSNKWFKFYEN